MTLPRWKKLLENSLDVSSNIPESRFFQVANVTVSKYSNEPIANNRTMVFRGFTLRDNFLLAICDNRSTKYKQWQQQPKSNICWYFTKSREQYRIANTIELLGNDSNQNYNDNQNIRKNVWNNLTEKAKSQFLSARPKPSLDNYQEDMYQKYLSTTQSKQPQNEEKYKSARRSRWENIAKVRRFYGID